MASPESDQAFREGRALLQAGKIAEACEAFARSKDLDPGVGTLLNLGDCREKQGRTATAWALFVEARDLAAKVKDKRGAEADKRATAAKAKLSYLTITVASERQLEGLVIKRNGIVVDRESWNTAVALDPGDYVIEASAPRAKPWSTTQPLGIKATTSIVVEALTMEPVPELPVGGVPDGDPKRDTVPGAAPGVSASRGTDPPVRPLSIGFGVGFTDEQDTILGARITGSLEVPHGAVRAVGSVLYAGYDESKLYALGLGVDYVWMPVPKLGFAAGLGFGQDRYMHDGITDTTGWWTLRASPVIVRLVKGRVEAGLHLQLVRTDQTVFLGVAAIDLFPL